MDLLNLLEASEQVGRVGSWEWRPGPDVLVWSDNLYRLLGLEPGEVTPTRRYMLERVHPADRDRLHRYAESIRHVRNPPPIEYRVEVRARGVRYLRSTITTVNSEGRGATRIVGALQDVTDEHEMARGVAAHLAVSRTFAEWDNLADGSVDLLSELGRAMEYVFGALWLPRSHLLLPIAVWSEPALELGELESATWALRLPLGTALPGRAWRSKRTEILTDVSGEAAASRGLTAGRSGLSGAIAFPALRANEVVAVLEFYHREKPRPFDRVNPTMVAIGYQLGEFFSRRGGQLGVSQLTARQLSVLRLAAAGNTTPQIAAKLGLSPSTVRTHLDHLFEKLGVSDRTAAVAQGMRVGLIQ